MLSMSFRLGKKRGREIMFLYTIFLMTLTLNILNMFRKDNKAKILTALNIFVICFSTVFIFEFK